MKPNYALPRVLLLSAALMWGGGFIGVQDALDHGWSVHHILGIRGLLGGSLLLIASAKTHWWRRKYLMRSGVFLGFLLWIGFGLQTLGQEASSPSNSAFLTALYIMLVPLILRIYKKRRIAIDVYVAMLLAMTGVGVLSLTSDFTIRLGDLLILIGAVAFALQIVFLEEIALEHDPVALTGIQLVTMGMLGCLWIPFAGPVAPTGGIFGLVYISVFSSCLAFLIQAKCQREVPPAATSLLLGTESVLGSLLSVLLGYEPLSQRLLWGGALFVFAILICELQPMQRYLTGRKKDGETIADIGHHIE